VAVSLSVDPELRGLLRLGVLGLAGVTVRERDAELEAEVAGHCEALRAHHAGSRSGDVPGVMAARSLYRGLGIDPTKTRPSNEALLRRVLKGASLYRVNTLVDALNVCSLLDQVPFGLYDLDHVRGPVLLRRGRPGETYPGIRKESVNVAGRPVLVDEVGPFGNPTSDSARTRIRADTRNALVVAFVPPRCDDAALGRLLDRTQALLMRFCGGEVRERCMLPT
jgi:DNA/RNA-binding domain of Phe-tRNA-synthetase-like protein